MKIKHELARSIEAKAEKASINKNAANPRNGNPKAKPVTLDVDSAKIDCDFCGNLFASEDALLKHVKNCHANQVFVNSVKLRCTFACCP